MCTISAPVVYAPLTAWLKQYGFKAMVTEWGAANGTQCASYVKDMLTYVASNSEVCHKYSLRIRLSTNMNTNSMSVHWLGSMGSGPLLGVE